MKNRRFLLYFLLLLLTGCASSERMFRMSGGILDEYSAPKSARLRSGKYQQVSKNLSSATRANKVEVAGLNDTLVNIWPFFFRSNDYWSILWPLIDKDPYGFAFRPFYNHEGDDYSILFPLSAWNNTAGHGWVTLFGWNKSGFGLVPLSWQWREKHSGGWYYTPLFFASYDNTPWEYTFDKDGRFTGAQWMRKEIDLFIMFGIYTRNSRIDKSKWSWLFYSRFDRKQDKNEWYYRMGREKKFPSSQLELEKFCQKIYAGLPKITETSYGIFPLWKSTIADDDSYRHNFLMFIDSAKDSRSRKFSIAGPIIGTYRKDTVTTFSAVKSTEKFTSWPLLSHFKKEEPYQKTPRYRSFSKLENLVSYRNDFNRQKPAIIDELKKFDPAVTLPDTVVDNRTYQIFLEELWQKYEFPTENSYSGRILPFYWYDFTPEYSFYALPALMTWHRRSDSGSFFGSIPLLTFIHRSKTQNTATILSPLVYWQQEKLRERSEQRIFSRETQRVKAWDCTVLNDLYIAGGLMYRGKFGFNIAKENIDASSVEKLRKLLSELPSNYQHIENVRSRIAGETALTDRWQTKTKIEKLKKLIRYEELKLQKESLKKTENTVKNETEKGLDLAKKLNFPLSPDTFKSKTAAEKARRQLIENYTEMRYYEDIGHGVFFRKEKNNNGDYNWHFCHILAGGEKKGDRENSHILHLLYRHRKEGSRSETICFPFISSVKDGENSRWSFLWRVFSLSKEDGKTGGYIFFVPFGSKW
ncbi:MAG: hypothetical protein IKC82_04915 [Lentisphaeria bacterium]|nr:hypothetical protein [Lentisphaeria bacterium]